MQQQQTHPPNNKMETEETKKLVIIKQLFQIITIDLKFETILCVF